MTKSEYEEFVQGIQSSMEELAGTVGMDVEDFTKSFILVTAHFTDMEDAGLKELNKSNHMASAKTRAAALYLMDVEGFVPSELSRRTAEMMYHHLMNA